MSRFVNITAMQSSIIVVFEFFLGYIKRGVCMLFPFNVVCRSAGSANPIESGKLRSYSRSADSLHTKIANNVHIAQVSILTCVMLVAGSVSHASENTLFDDRLEVNLLLMQGFQAIQAADGAFRPGDEEQESNFLRPRFNLQLKFKITDNIVADVDIAEEPNDFGNNGDRDFSFHQDFGGIEFNLLGLAGRASEDKNLTLRIGNIGAAPFQFKGFQDGADNQGNALVGNSPVDYATAENGVQLSYTQTLGDGRIESYNVAGHITGSSFGEQFQEDRGFNGRLQGTLNFAGGFKVGVNFFQADQGDQLNFDAGGVASLDGVTTTNYRFGDGENYNFSASGSSSRETHIGIMPGLDMSIAQFNIAYQPNANTSLIAMIGRAEDDFAFSNAAGDVLPGIVSFDAAGNRFESNEVVEADSAVDFYVLEAQQYLVPGKFYVAGRFTSATNDTDGVSGDDTLERIQVAGGYWLNDKTLWKFEYVDQDEEANSGGQIGAGFDGIITELSVKF